MSPFSIFHLFRLKFRVIKLCLLTSPTYKNRAFQLYWRGDIKDSVNFIPFKIHSEFAQEAKIWLSWSSHFILSNVIEDQKFWSSGVPWNSLKIWLNRHLNEINNSKKVTSRSQQKQPLTKFWVIFIHICFYMKWWWEWGEVRYTYV